MALDIVTQEIIIDETTGLQDDDVNPSVLPHLTDPTLLYLLSRDGAGGLSSPAVAFQTNFVQASASEGETISSVVLSQSATGTPFSTTVGVNSGIRTVDGNYVWLFQDPTHANVVIGVIGTADPLAEPAETGPLAFSLGLLSTSATNADLYTVQYVPLFHPDATSADDRIDLTNKVFASVTGTSVVSFTGENAHPGSNEFNLLSSPDDASKQLLVTGLVRSSQADPNSALVNSECNVSQQGFGVDNQSINPDTDGQNQPRGREVLQVDFVTGGTPSAGDGADIAYGSHLNNVTQAGFIINQLTPSTPSGRVDIKISAFDVQGDEQGSGFFDGSPTNPVNITSLTLTGASGLSTITVDGTYATASGNVTVTGLSGTGNIVTITGLDNVTTVDFTTSSPMDRLHVEAVDANEGLDITEVHFTTQNTNAHTEEVGSFINFDDDGPTAGLTETAATVLHDETAGVDAGSDDQAAALPAAFAALGTALGWAASASAVVTPNSSFGADGAGTQTLSLGVSGANADSGFDSLDGHNILLNVEGGLVVGRVDVGNDGSTTGDPIAIAISISQGGILSVAQYVAIAHQDAGNPDDVETMLDSALLAVVTATDGDGDSNSSAGIAIGNKVQIRDDGPSIVRSIVPIPELTVDESDTTSDSGDFSVLFTAAFGNDGPADAGGGLTYALGVFGGGTDVASGLFDTQSGLEVLLNLEGDDIVGRAGTDEVFRISVDADGNVTLDQSRGVVHGDPSDPDEADTPATMAANLVTLAATATDGDGDSAPTTVDIGDAFNFEDDGPAVTVPFDGDPGTAGVQHETLANAAGASASGAFGYDIGADAHPDAFYTGGGSDFVDQDPVLAGVQIGLSGTIVGGGGGNVLTPEVTLQSESATSATFDFSFTYDQDPAAGVQAGTAGGTLVFDKANDTYTITLTDPLEGFSFDVLHTSELLSKEPTSNTGHPNIVVEKLFEADSTPEATDRDFFVQFTANSTTNNIKFGLNTTGDSDASTPADTAWNPGDLVTNNHEDWVSATRTTNGVAGDTIQKGELLTLRFFDHSPGIATEDITPNQTAGAMAIKFDGIGNSEDLMLILDLIDKNGADNIAGNADDNATITRAVYVSNADIFKKGQVPDPYASEFPLDNNDGLVIVEQNDYNAAGEDYVLQGVQIMQSGNGIAGNNTAIDLNRTTGAGGGSFATPLVNFDGADNDVLKITDIGFTTTVTQAPDANLDFAFQVEDADADQAAVQHILVDVA
ncbi:DUF5801 repeats-in-toxin domain-containing protein [Mesorhizobium sp. LjNodule214]|uniref:DUF5801 repeats-in-toxin domain-containing protein n=1 Tax=Mesorhizobium sp. LjNodule214 TaxID=3342252 RepID=UPI003ECD1C54